MYTEVFREYSSVYIFLYDFVSDYDYEKITLPGLF